MRLILFPKYVPGESNDSRKQAPTMAGLQSLVKSKRAHIRSVDGIDFLDLASRESKLNGYLLDVASHAQTQQYKRAVYWRRYSACRRIRATAHWREAFCVGFVRICMRAGACDAGANPKR